MSTQTNPIITMIPPSNIKVGENIRFNLKKFKVQALKDSILEAGEVQVPLEVEPKGEDGLYPLVSGHYRQAAGEIIEREAGGFLVPCIIRPTLDSLDRIKRQLRENVERESLSYMDEAVAIKRLMDAGVSRTEIRQIFAKPGGRKGMVVSPVSNSYINQVMDFLTLPKKIVIKVREENRTVNLQEMIHDGRVAFAGGTELVKVLKEKGLPELTAVLERIEEMRQKQIDRDEMEENKFITAGAKAEALEAKRKADEEAAQTLASAFESAKTAVDLAKEKAIAEDTKLTKAFNAKRAKVSAPTKAEAEKAGKLLEQQYRSAEVESKNAHRVLESAQATLDKLKGKVQIAEEKAKQKAAPAPKPEPKPIGHTEVEAAMETVKPLTAMQMREEVNLLCLPGTPDKVKAIGEALKVVFAGLPTPLTLTATLAKLTGEKFKGK